MENEIFDEMYKVETQHWWFVSKRKIVSKVISILQLQKNSLILDLGCANGDNLKMLSNFGEVTAIESMSDAYERAKKRKICSVYLGKLPNDIPGQVSKDNDLIVMLDVLEHIEKDGDCLTVLHNYLNDAGYLLMTVPAYQFLWSHHDELHHHKRRYTVKKLRNLIENNGWKIQYISYYNTFLFPLALVDRIKQKIFPSAESEGLKMPPKYINSLFQKIFSFESRFIGNITFPFGLSIIVVVKKS